MTNLQTKEVVVVVHSEIEGKEDVAFRVEMRTQQVIDTLQRISYSGEIFGAFMRFACESLELEMSDCTADAYFPDITYNARKMGISRDLLKPRVGMRTFDITDGTFLLH